MPATFDALTVGQVVNIGATAADGPAVATFCSSFASRWDQEAGLPDALVYGDTYGGTTSLRTDQDLHPALLKRYAGRRIRYASLYGCGVPESGRVTKVLQDTLLKVQQ